VSELPIDLCLGVSIIAAGKYGCVEEVLSIASLLSESASLFFRPKDKQMLADSARSRFTDKDGADFSTLNNIWVQFVDNDYSQVWCKENFLQYRTLNRARQVRDQLSLLAEKIELDPTSTSSGNFIPVAKSFTSGFFIHAVRLDRDGQSYRTLGKGNSTVYIHPSSVLGRREENSLPPKILVYFVSPSKIPNAACLEISLF
jgi:pre-mRNA-splicing factor ATP-dependent RNA helicase DHX16